MVASEDSRRVLNAVLEQIAERICERHCHEDARLVVRCRARKLRELVCAGTGEASGPFQLDEPAVHGLCHRELTAMV